MDRLLPQNLRRDGVDYYRRARILVASYLAVATFNLLTLIIFVGPLEERMLAVALAGAWGVGLLVIPVLRQTGSVSMAGNVFLLQIWFLLHAIAYFLDGGYGPSLALVLYLPVLAIAICNKNSGLAWTVLVGAEVIVLSAWTLSVFPQGPWVGQKGTLVIFTLTFLCLLVHLTTTAFFYEEFKDRTLERLSRTNEQLSRARDRALEANRAKGVFVANMSHELRTPLNAVIGYADMLAEDVDAISSAELTADLLRIKSSGKHLLRLINELLEFSRMEAGHIPLERDAFPLALLVKELVSTMENEAKKNGNILEVVKASGVGDESDEELFCSDPTKLRQCLYNLVANACKFTKDGRVAIRFELIKAVSAQGSDLAIFEVVDSGIGMTAEQLERVFEPFVQAEESIARQFGGTGLGLSLSRRLATALGGSLEAFSQVGEGSRFVLTIPDLSEKVEQTTEELSSKGQVELPYRVQERLLSGAGRGSSQE